MNIQITEAEIQAEIRRLYPNLDPGYDPFKEVREQYVRESLARHRRYMFLEDNITLFQTEGLYVRDPEGKITSRELYNIYKRWCLDQKIPLHPPREFWLHARNHAAQYRFVYSTCIPDQNGKRCRGFYGIRPLQEDEKSTTLL